MAGNQPALKAHLPVTIFAAFPIVLGYIQLILVAYLAIKIIIWIISGAHKPKIISLVMHKNNCSSVWQFLNQVHQELQEHKDNMKTFNDIPFVNENL